MIKPRGEGSCLDPFEVSPKETRQREERGFLLQRVNSVSLFKAILSSNLERSILTGLQNLRTRSQERKS